ncbi:hypothetical protein C8039_19960 [Halogeometricum sp. wsp3]|nr:hypothetical protein C8039_19960 [Halogeometricum sp. wsp3]
MPPVRAGRYRHQSAGPTNGWPMQHVVRSLPEPSAVRASTHAVNTESEVDRLATALTAEF